MKWKQPMFAGKIETGAEKLLRFPVQVTPKIDGIRCVLPHDHKEALSRSFKRIPNDWIQSELSRLPRGFDGELIIPGKSFSETQSAIMSRDGRPKFQYLVFDYVSETVSGPGFNTPYVERMREAMYIFQQMTSRPTWLRLLMPEPINTFAELEEYEKAALEQGFEGVMIRSPQGPYKFGRSTPREGYLLKLKRFEDSEAVVTGFEEMLRNENEAGTDNFGRMKRSSAAAGLVPAGTLGKLLVREIGDTPWKGLSFAIGTGEGLTQELRKKIWDHRDQYLGKVVNYTYQSVGTKELPRLPIFRGFRDLRDL